MDSFAQLVVACESHIDVLRVGHVQTVGVEMGGGLVDVVDDGDLVLTFESATRLAKRDCGPFLSGPGVNSIRLTSWTLDFKLFSRLLIVQQPHQSLISLQLQLLEPPQVDPFVVPLISRCRHLPLLVIHLSTRLPDALIICFFGLDASS